MLNAATILHTRCWPNNTQNSVLTENSIWFDHNYEVNKLLRNGNEFKLINAFLAYWNLLDTKWMHVRKYEYGTFCGLRSLPDRTPSTHWDMAKLQINTKMSVLTLYQMNDDGRKMDMNLNSQTQIRTIKWASRKPNTIPFETKYGYN